MIQPQFFVLVGLVLLSFLLQINLYPLLPEFKDPYLAKDFMSVMISITIVCVFFRQSIAPKVPRSLLILLVFCVLRCFITPLFSYPLLNVHELSIWQFKSLSYLFIFTLLFIAVANFDWNKNNIRLFFSVVCWIGFLTAVYVIIQWFNLDQWLVLRDTEEVRHTPSAQLTGTMRNVTLAAAFLALTLPFMIQSRRWFFFGVTLVAILLCKSDMAYIAVFLMGLWYLWFLRPWGNVIVRFLIVVLIIIGAFLFFNPELRPKIQDNGRFPVWKQLVTDVLRSPLEPDRHYFFTGYGLGTYHYVFTSLHTTSEDGSMIAYDKAHNEFLEWFYNTGFIGIALLIFFILSLISPVIIYIVTDERYLAIMTSFIGAIILACGSFIWQVEPHRFFIVILAALIYNLIIKRETGKCSEN